MAESEDYNSSEEENEFEELDFNEVEDMLKMGFDEGGPSKPIFETNTNATVKSMALSRGTKPKTNKNGKNEYYDIKVTITCEVDGKKDNEGNPLETVDNYGGLRQYDGYFWSGEESAFAVLRKLMEAEYGVKNVMEMIKKIKGKEVKIKTITNNYRNKDYKKNVIQSFR